MKALRIITIIGIILLSASLTGCFGKSPLGKTPEPEPEKIKVAFVHDGPIGIYYSNYAHEQGRKFLMKEMPEVESVAVEISPQGKGIETVLDELARQGNRVIFITTPLYGSEVAEAARNHPDTVFLHNAVCRAENNNGGYMTRNYQATYLTGLAAGKQTKTNIIGYTATAATPEAVRSLNAFALGARAVNPNVKIKAIWVDKRHDRIAEKEATERLLKEKADVIALDLENSAAEKIVKDAGMKAIILNMTADYPQSDTILTGIVYNWGPYYLQTVQKIAAKKWKTGCYWAPMADKIFDIMPPTGTLNANERRFISECREEIITGRWDVFTGPLKKQDGEIIIPAGRRMSDRELMYMDRFVIGVEILE